MREGGGGADNSLGPELNAGTAAQLEQENSLLKQELQQANSTSESLRMELQVCPSVCLSVYLQLTLYSVWARKLSYHSELY